MSANCVELVLLSTPGFVKNSVLFTASFVVVCCTMFYICFHPSAQKKTLQKRESEVKKLAQVRQNRTAGQLLPYGFEVRTQHQLGSVLHRKELPLIAYKGFIQEIISNKQNPLMLVRKIKARVVTIRVTIRIETLQTTSH